MTTPNEIRSKITSQIVQALESGSIPWRRPWQISPNASGRPRNVASKKPYSGVNFLLLALHSMKYGFQSRFYGTFQQWSALGGKVKSRPVDVEPGDYGCHIVFYRPVSKTTTNPTTGKEEQERFAVLRSYCVFCADQVEGKAVEKYQVQEESGGTLPNFAPADNLIAATGADIRITGESAFYSVPTPEKSWPNHTGGDYIQVPQPQKFISPGAWYGTVFHEIGHWCEPRLDFRPEQNAYAMGELVAEMSAAFLSTELGIPGGEDMSNHAAYLQSWLRAMKNDVGFIFKASTQASKVVDFILSHQKQTQQQTEAEAA